MSRRNPHDGSSFEAFLEEEGLLEEASEHAIKAVLAWQLAQTMQSGKINKSAMAKKLQTSRSQLDRLLDPANDNVTLRTLSKAANAIGKRLRIELVDSPRATAKRKSTSNALRAK